MADGRRVDSALVDSALASGSLPVRAAAALAAGQLREPRFAGHLRALLSDSDTTTAASAAFALGLLRDSASVPALAAVLAESDPVSAEAAWALGEIGAPARSAIVGALNAGASARRSTRVVPALLLAAAKLRPLPVEAILPHLASRGRDAEVVRAAAYALARSRARGGVRRLLEVAASTDEETRQHVARGLARAAAGDSLAEAALAALAVLAVDGNAHVRVNAVRSLGTYGALARGPLLAGARDVDANVRVAVAQSLANVLPPTREAWREPWASDTGFMYRRSLLASAAATGLLLGPLDASSTDDWRRSPDWRYRAAAAEAAGSAPDAARVAELVEPLTRDADGRVRAAAFGVIAPWVDSSVADSVARRLRLVSALRDADVAVRATVLAALATRARAAETSAVLASYRVAGADSMNDARVAAVRYLAAAWRRDSASFSDSLRAALSALPAADDPLVAAEGKGIAPLAAWRIPSSPARPLAWYEGLVRDVALPSRAGRAPVAELVTERGTIGIVLFGEDAPLTVRNFATLARSGYYRGTRFHRVVPNFVAQDGDPRGDGNGGPGYAIRDELNRRRYERGAVGMALSGPDTGGSQYFLTLSRQPHLDGHYTVFGRVVAGAQVMDRLVQGDRILEVRVR